MSVWTVSLRWRNDELIYMARCLSVSLAATVQVAIDALACVVKDAHQMDLASIRLTIERA